MPSITARNHVTIRGTGRQPMLMAHGFGCDQNMWRLVAPAFEKDFRVVRFDYVGSGGSDLSAYDPARYADLDGYRRDVSEIIEELDLRDIVFVGHSVSAIVGILAAIERPERFARMILIGPSARYVNDGGAGYVGGFEPTDLEELLDLMDRNYLGWANLFAPVVVGNTDRPELVGELSEAFCSTDPTIARRFAEATFFADNRKDLPGMAVPSLVLQCAEDDIAPVEAGRYVAEHLPRATFVQMEATGHCPQLSHPEETIRRIREYLDSSAPSSAL